MDTGVGALFLQLAFTETVETEMQTFDLLYSILDGRIEILRPANDFVVLLTERTIVLFFFE